MQQQEETNSVVAIFDSHERAEEAIKQLERGGYDMSQLSIVGKDYHTEDHVVGYYNTGDRVKFWGKLGAFWGGMVGLLFGSAFLMIPGVGHVFIVGRLVAWVVQGLTGALTVGGLSALGAALYSLGIPKDSVLAYERALKTNHFLVLAHGTRSEIHRAREILGSSGATEVAVHISDAVPSGID